MSQDSLPPAQARFPANHLSLITTSSVFKTSLPLRTFRLNTISHSVIHWQSAAEAPGSLLKTQTLDSTPEMLNQGLYICSKHSRCALNTFKFNSPPSPGDDLAGDGSSTWHKLEKRDLGELRQKSFSFCQGKQLKVQRSIPPEPAAFPRPCKTMASSYIADVQKT